jgi:hypothetical protein
MNLFGFHSPMLEQIKKHKLASGLLLTSAAVVLAGFAWAMASLGEMPNSLVLHFNDLRGITAVGGMGVIVFGGIFGIVVVFVNGCLALELEERNPFFGTLIAVLTLVFAILLFIAFATIISVN